MSSVNASATDVRSGFWLWPKGHMLLHPATRCRWCDHGRVTCPTCFGLGGPECYRCSGKGRIVCLVCGGQAVV